MSSSQDPAQAGEVIFIGGRAGSGKSSLAAEIGAVLTRRRIKHAVIEGDALDLAWPPPWEHGLAERNLEAMWRNYSSLGYHRLVYCNTAAARKDTQALLIVALKAVGPVKKVTSILLAATDATVGDRLGRREKGSELEAHLERSARAAVELEMVAAPGTVRVATDERALTPIAEHVLRIAGWHQVPG